MAFINPNPILPDIPFTPELGATLSFSKNQPLVLFPVRLETRFFAQADGSSELRVRVYPDKVEIDAHEPELTSQEVTWGKSYWDAAWRAAKDEAAKKLAFRDLAQRFGATRAAWIARALTPTNQSDRPKEPVAAGKKLAVEPKFPTVTKKSSAWSRPALSRVLPKRWYILGYAGNTLVTQVAGNPIPAELAVGPDPTSTTAMDPNLPIDPGMKWMIDFDEAERVGMGVRLRLTRDQAARGFDILLALGTRAAPDGADQTKDLVRLLDGHHYTDGLGFILNGTPSNNTPDAPSGFTSNDPAHEQAYAAEFGQGAIAAGDGSNADTLCRALGLSGDNAKALAKVAHAAAKEPADALHMNRALWPATFGYFLEQMLDSTRTSPDDRAWARDFFVQYVRGAGPLPALRIGKQPYGVLPVTSLNHWATGAGQEVALHRDSVTKDVLLRLRNQWRQNLTQVPRVGRSDNPDKDFAEILSLDGISSSYAIRHLLGEVTLSSILSCHSKADQSLWWKKQRELTVQRLSALGFDLDPRLAHATYSGLFTALKGAVVQAEVLSEDSALTPNYIELLLNATDLNTLRQESFPGGKPQGLLYALLRAALLLEHWGACAKLTPPASDADLSVVDLRRDRDNPILQGAGLGVWELLARPTSVIGVPVSGNTIGGYLGPLRTTPSDPKLQAATRDLLELRTSYEHLKSVKAARLQRAMANSLDACSHRLDAWITAFATKRLDDMRKSSPSGVALGAYGWVMNLKPGPALTTDRLAPDQPVLLKPANNPGYSHAPSLGQAATVAVLRNGHLTHSDEATRDLLALDLSSERVRLAEWLLDGVRQGQPLGALLGYRFERRLQESGLQEFIASFREVAPLVAKKLSTTLDRNVDQAAESVAANNVVDGLVLHGKWKALGAPTSPAAVASLFTGSQKPPNAQRLQQEQPRLLAALNLLDDSVDAVSDALVAESVHQTVLGNPSRTASTLAAVASGEAPPPELNLMRTPRTGSSLTERVVALFFGPQALGPGWTTPTAPARADAEPQLNAWVSTLLGDPTRVRCNIEQLDKQSGAVLATKELKLSELNLSPLDLVYASEGSRDRQPSELEHRLLYAFGRKAGGFEAGSQLRVSPKRASGWAVTDLSYGEFVELLRSVRNLIANARTLDASDLAPPEKNQPAAVNLAELEARAVKAEAALRLVQTDLQAKLADAASTSDVLREVLLRAASFGISGAVPLSASGNAKSAREALRVQCTSSLRQLTERADKLTALGKAFKPDTATDAQKLAFQLDRLHVAFGSAFVVMPTFTPENATELGKALADSKQIQDNDSLNVITWFTRYSRVRDGVARMHSTFSYAEALDAGDRLRLRVAQLPYRENDRWVGMPLGKGQTLSGSRFSLVVQAGAVDVKLPMSGLLIDEWVTVVPEASETTGVVFQYDQPDAAPPQSILLAVPPDPDATWTVWSLQQVLIETLDLARLRAVDPDTLDEVGHFLPGLYLAFNAAGDTVSTDFTALK